MVSVVQEAVQRLRDLCRPARNIAAWYKAHPDQLWLPTNLQHLRDADWISVADLGEVLGLKRYVSVNKWLIDNPEVQQKSETRGRRWVSFADMQRVLLALMPKNFPWFNGDETQSYSSTLVVVRHNEMHARKGTFACVLGECGVQAFEHWLSGHDGGKKPSVFARWGFTDRDGTPIEITTHSFRHWLNTVAQIRGMSYLDIAKWRGRDPSQNQAYNHVTPEETHSQIRELLEENGGIGPLFEAANLERANRPVSRHDFLAAQIGSAHVTDYGICIHDYSLLPCQVLGDCLGCSENIFVKGDRKHHDRVEKRLELAKMQIDQSRQAEAEGTCGADRRTRDHQRKIEVMRSILAIHQDDSTPDGTIINLEAARQDNEIAMSIRDRDANQGVGAQLDAPSAPNAADALRTMWDD